MVGGGGRAGAGATIQIRTGKGTVHCSPDEIVPKRLGVHVKQRSILLEYEVPRHGLLVHHPIEVKLDTAVATGTSCASGAAPAGYPSVPAAGGGSRRVDDAAVAEQLRRSHRPWLDGVQLEQLAALVGRLRNGAAGTAEGAALVGGGAAEGGPGGAANAKQPRRERVKGIPETARASKRSKEPEMRKAFDIIDGASKGEVDLEDLRAFLCDYLGFGQAEVEAFFEGHRGSDGGGVTFERFREGYATLNPFQLGPGRQGEVLVRKPGSLGGLQQAYSAQQANLEGLEDCEVYICTPTAQAFVDLCKRCVILLGPCESSIFVRDCEDCVIWLAAQQLRTRDCKRCTFHLYSKTEPIIETSEDLAFAPWCASYPGCAAQFAKAKFDPQRNFWNAVFDFNGELGRSHWRILALEEVRALEVELCEPPVTAEEPSNPLPEVTHAILCARPLSSEDSCGQGVANIPQTRPEPPPPPSGAAAAAVPVLRVRDARAEREVGALHLDSFPRR